MRRIDLLCKLAAPVFVSVIAILAGSVHATIFIIAGMNLVSVGVEWFAAKSVWMKCIKLHAPKSISEPDRADEPGEIGLSRIESRRERWSGGLILFFRSEIWIRKFSQPFSFGVLLGACIHWSLASLALALLYFSVLSFSASMITYLLNAGFTLSVITAARTGSTLIEVSATVVMPWSVKAIEKTAAWKARRAHGPAQLVKPAAAVERTGLWGLWWMVLNLVGRPPPLLSQPLRND